MNNLDMQAFGNQYDGLTKKEYALIKIAAALAQGAASIPSAHLVSSTDVVKSAKAIVEELFK